ncbi:ABC transporter atnG, partial [Colletotrichum shisoi]
TVPLQTPACPNSGGGTLASIFFHEEILLSVAPCSLAILWGLHRCLRLWSRPAVSQGSVLAARHLAGCIILAVVLLLLFPSALVVAPAAAVLVSGLIGYRRRPGRRPESPQGSRLLTRKMILWQALAAFQLAALLILVWIATTNTPPDATSGIAVASWSLSLASSLLLVLVSRLEHSRSRPPSALLQTFLLATIVLDAARFRTAWFSAGEPVHDEARQLLPVQLIIKILLLIAESGSKAAVIAIPARRISREEASGIVGTAFALWILPLLSSGWRKDLTVDDLEPMDEALSSERVLDKLSSAWQRADPDRSHALALAVLRAFWVEVLIIHIPRLAVVGFGLVQPLLVRTTIRYIRNHDGDGTADASLGSWLVAAFAVTYLGLAISTQLCGQLTNRLITRLRGSLVALVYQTMLSLRAETGTSQAAVSLMSTEVERINVTAQWSFSIVPNLLQLAVALRILAGQLGGVSVAPVVVAILCVSAGVRVGQLVPPRQPRWMQAIQRRVGITTDIIGSVRGVKMSGLSATVRDQIQGLRDSELDESKRFCRMQIVNVVLGQFPSIVTPSITFAALAVVQKLSGGPPLDVVQAFTSLSLLGILIDPVTELVMIPNNLGSTIGCLDRIQEFLVREKRDDYRRLTPRRPPTRGHDDGETTESPARPSQPLITVSDGSFGWRAAEPILHGLNLDIRPSTLTMLVGPVGSGKSTLLKSLVGETHRIAGSVEYHTATADVAYCDQDPWILNQSIRDNICGGGSGAAHDPDLYGKVIRACQLEEDLGLLPQGDETLVGASGAALSGGQRHRVILVAGKDAKALARAVYSGKQVVIMDDNLKGLDSNTASRCFHALFGPGGLLRGNDNAVILATHNAQWLRHADTIVALGADGTISERGSYEELSKSRGYVSSLHVSQQRGHTDDTDDDDDDDDDNKLSSEAEHPEQQNGTKRDKLVSAGAPGPSPNPRARGAANTSSLLYYIKSMGVPSFALFLAMVLTQTLCRTMQRLWVKFWVAASEGGGQQSVSLWAGVYILWGVMTEAVFAAEVFWFLVVVVPHSAKGLHFSVLKAAIAAPLSFFVKTDTGVVINRFSQDMNLVDLPLPIAFLLTFDSLTLTIADVNLTCVATGYLALAIPFLAAVLYAIQRVRLLDLETKSPIFSHFIASFAGLVTIRAMDRTAECQAENLTRLDLSQRASYAMGSLQRWLLLVLNLVVAGLAVMLVGLAVALRDAIDPGLLGVALVSVMGFGQLLTGLLNNWATLETSLGAVARIREFEAETPSEQDRDGDTPVIVEEWPAKGKIDVKHVSAAYDDHQVLGDVTLSINPGEKVAICGRTGSGKSTLIALLLRLQDPSSGTIEIDGVDIASVPINQLRESLVALPQDPLFLPGTVRRNLDPFDARDDDAVWAALDKTGPKALFEDKGGLEAGLKTDWLSAGQKQLFCMARAVLRNSRATEQVVRDLIRNEFQGWTVVVIAHRLKAVADFDKVVTLQDGRVVEFDRPATLLEKGGVFASLWKLQEG